MNAENSGFKSITNPLQRLKAGSAEVAWWACVGEGADPAGLAAQHERLYHPCQRVTEKRAVHQVRSV